MKADACRHRNGSYLRAAKAAGMTPDEMADAVSFVALHPTAGALISGTGGARKLRLAKAHGGKSGGYRIITYYCAEDVPVFLMDVYSKGDKDNLTHAERNEFRLILANLAEEWRKGVRQAVRTKQ